MKISERIRRVNGEKPDFAIDDIGDIGHWQGMNDAVLIAEAEELVQLTDDQQVVLESLKHYYSKSNYYDIRAGKEPMQAVDRVLVEAESDATGLSDVYYSLTGKQQFQVLAAFAEWGLKEGEG